MQSWVKTSLLCCVVCVAAVGVAGADSRLHLLQYPRRVQEVCNANGGGSLATGADQAGQHGSDTEDGECWLTKSVSNLKLTRLHSTPAVDAMELATILPLGIEIIQCRRAVARATTA